MLSLLAETVSVPFNIPGVISIDDMMVEAALRHDLVSRYFLLSSFRHAGSVMRGLEGLHTYIAS
jgi:hypothetical protein